MYASGSPEREAGHWIGSGFYFILTLAGLSEDFKGITLDQTPWPITSIAWVSFHPGEGLGFVRDGRVYYVREECGAIMRLSRNWCLWTRNGLVMSVVDLSGE